MAASSIHRYTGFYLVLFGLFISTIADFESADEYFEAWHNSEHGLEVDPSRIYPFSTDFYDEQMLHAQTQDLLIGFNFPFLGRDYHIATMSDQGIVGFSDTIPRYDFDHPLPSPDYPDWPDPPALVPFFHSTRVGSYFWRRLDPDDDGVGTVRYQVTQQMLQQISNQVRRSVLTASSFQASHGFIVTWYKAKPALCPLDLENTMQVALVTDEQHTFAVFNYHDLTWSGTCIGPEYAAQAGFNVGYGKQFIPLPHSTTEDVIKLAEYSGALHIQGRYIFDVTMPKMERGGCIDNLEASHLPEWPIEHYPHSIHMFGGREVQFTGLCPTPEDTITCKYGWEDAEEYPGHVIDEWRVGCIPPPVPFNGDMPVWLYMRDQVYSTFVHIEPYPDKDPKVTLVDFRTTWYAMNPDELTLTWNPNDLDLGGPPINGSVSTLPPIVPAVNIKLFGYKETRPEGEHMQKHMMEVHVLEFEGENDGEFTFLPENHRCVEEDAPEGCDWHVGAIQISLANAQRSSVIWSRVIPLGWFVHDVMTHRLGPDWHVEKCREWADNDDLEELLVGMDAGGWLAQIPACPCTLPQALADVGRWIVDPDCNPPNPDEPEPCPLHPSAEMCFVPPRPSPTGAQSKCCYNKEGNLMYSQDSREGSFPGKVHQEGVSDYRYPPIVPAMSHWVRDKIPHFWCCRWTQEPEVCHTDFSQRRPTPECYKYKEPRQGAAYGDPHFHTFDGNSFVFNGQGEFWMLRVEDQVLPENNFYLQARFQQPLNGEWGFVTEPRATIITTLVMQQGVVDPMDHHNLPPVQVFLDPAHPIVDYSTLSVYADGQRLNLEEAGITTFNIRDPTSDKYIRINLEGAHERPDNVTVIFPSDVAVQVAAREGVLQTIVYVPPELYGKTSGLFGVWNDDPTDDLWPPYNNSEPVNPEDPETVHNTFGLLWNVSESESLFHYFSSMNWEYYNANLDFIPEFNPQLPPDTDITEQDVDQVCGENYECRFDYITTLDMQVAMETIQQHNWVQQAANFSKPVPGCIPISIPHSHREVTHYLVNGQVRIVDCYNGYTRQGPELYTCRQHGDTAAWDPEVTTICEDDADIAARKKKLAVSISVPLALLALACIVIVLLVFVFKVRPGQKRPPKDQMPHNGVSHEPDPLSGSKTPSRHSSMASVNSVVLREELKMARPPRPQRGSRPPSMGEPSIGEPETLPPNRPYDNQAADFGSRDLKIERPADRPAPILNKPDLGRYTSKESLDKIFNRMGQENPAFRSREDIPPRPAVGDTHTLERAQPAPADSIPPVPGYQRQQPYPEAGRMYHAHSNPAMADTDEVDENLGEPDSPYDHPYRAPTPPYPYNPRAIFVPSSQGSNSFV